MKIGTRVEYHTAPGCSGFGRITAIDEESEVITVKDEDDGSNWTGPMDKAETADEEE